MGRGDYFPGYYRGDPGFLGNVFRGITRTIGGAGIGFLTGGPGGAIKGALTGAASAIHRNIQVSTLEAGDQGSAMTPALRAAHAAALARGARGASRPGGTPTIGYGGVKRLGPGGGYTPSKRHLHALEMGLARAKPRLNPFNPHALRRAARRAHSFLKMSRRLVAYYTPKAHKGKAYIKAKARKR
jgi:hypothetical protein